MRTPEISSPGTTAAPGGKSLGEAFDPRDNNFDVIRLLAALLVLVSHCYPLTGTVIEPFARYLGEYDTGGGWGVSIFFVISGFLVTRSVVERPTAVYLRSRILRIVPALALVTLFEVFLIGPVFTTLPLAEYFTDGGTFAHLRNVTVFWLTQTLPATFAGNPLPFQVNGSIWTLPIESAFYIMLPIAAAAGLMKPGRSLILLALAAAALAYGTILHDWHWGNRGPLLFAGGPAFIVAKEAVFFLAGSCLWLHRDKVPYNAGLALCCVLLLVIFAGRDGRFVAMAIALPYLTIYAAFAKPLRVRMYDRIGDLSYGTYLFAFPVQQSFVALFGANLAPLALAALATPVTLALAALSWHLVERPALNIRHGRASR